MAAVWVVGTWDTKAEELEYLAGLLRQRGVATRTVDVGTSGQAVVGADLPTAEVARAHPEGAGAVFGGGDRGAAVVAMSAALCARVRAALQAGDIAGMIAVGGSGGTSLIAPAMRLLPIGMPKLMVSTMAAGDVGPFVGVVDMTLMFPVTDIAGLNRLSLRILGNAAHAMAGMVQGELPAAGGDTRPAVGCTMFGVTTPCVQALRAALAAQFDVQVFHANGSGGRAMEALAASGMLDGIIDVTTTEVLQHIVGGVCDAGPDRLQAATEHGLPWVGSVGALDMVNWFAPDTVPERFRQRRFHAHNANVTLMRSTADELREAGRVIAGRLNRAPGPVRLLLPLGGLSALDAPGQPFHDPQADAALFQTLAEQFVASDSHRLVEVTEHINAPAFADAIAGHARECFAPLLA
jgi:uncharacterized protein (UPF0261 family)